MSRYVAESITTNARHSGHAARSLSTAHKTKDTAVWDRLYIVCISGLPSWSLESWDAWRIEHATSAIPQRCNRKWTTLISCSRWMSSQKTWWRRPNNSPIASPRKILGTGTTVWCTQDTVHPLHQGATWEDWKGLCPSGGEACLQNQRKLWKEN